MEHQTEENTTDQTTKYPKFHYGYVEARDKDGFPLYTIKKVFNKKGKLIEIKEPIKRWGKILEPLDRFNCSKCGASTRKQHLPSRFDIGGWIKLFSSKK